MAIHWGLLSSSTLATTISKMGSLSTTTLASGLSSGHAGSSRRPTSNYENRIQGNFGNCIGFVPEGLGRWIEYPLGLDAGSLDGGRNDLLIADYGCGCRARGAASSSR
jgi:hypothetical protein